jgi:5-formyltetrahydrofolate cyclo-ligase
LNKNPLLAATLNGNKEKLRIKGLELRSSFSEQQIEDLSVKITKHLIKNFNFEKKNIHLHYPIKGKNEVNTWLLHEEIKLTSILYTSTIVKNSKSWECITFSKNSPFKLTTYNVPVPVEYEFANCSNIELIIIPLIVFDDLGNRLGYGKGIYDQILSYLNPNCIKIGVSILEISNEKIDHQAHDIPLDFIQTPTKLHDFSKKL